VADPVLSVSTPNGRFYAHPKDRNRLVPSITNVIAQKDKPALKFWAARQCAEFAADNVDVIKALKRAEAIDLVRGAPFRKGDVSANVGILVHEWVDEYAKKFVQGPVLDDVPEGFYEAPKTAQNMWQAFLTLNEKHPLHFVSSETTVWSDTHEYAGTLDWIARVGGPDGPMVLGDTKTGKGVYPEVGMQLAAAENADYAFDANGERYALPRFEKHAVMHLRPTFAKLLPIQGSAQSFKAFLGLRAVFDWQINYADNIIEYAPKLEVSS